MIRVRAVTRLFGAVTALDDVDLEVPEGQFVALMGHNGAGKSTLLRAVAGLTRPTQGTVELAGQELRRAPSARSLIGVLAHESYLYGPLSARENLQLYATLYGLEDVERRVADGLEATGMSWAADLRVETMSRGMEQRVALSRALLHDPKILLLDEPFSGLDRAADQFLMDRLAELRAAGKTALLVTHDPGRAVRCADRVVVLHRGRIRADELVTPEMAPTFPETYVSLLGEGVVR